MKNILYTGKVRDIYAHEDSNKLYIKTTDRLSSFDKHICNLKNKGKILTSICAFMFNKTKHIIPNHYISHINNILVVKKCIPAKIEFVVRGYITGNTKTSLWTHYNNGVRNYCGIQFPDNLKKNQKLAEPVITPTTKDIEDIPISKEDIINRNYMSQTECDFVYKKTMELFKYGQKMADNAGFILIDTKYEFGKDENNNIILIDEIHTCDSSRYWIKKTYENRYKNDIEPEKIDKDIIRDWVKNQCNPYTDKIPEVPEDLKKKTIELYENFYKNIVKFI
jgi:phosphoribosylaminoimidazole-succinocarboxamide synthase